MGLPLPRNDCYAYRETANSVDEYLANHASNELDGTVVNDTAREAQDLGPLFNSWYRWNGQLPKRTSFNIAREEISGVPCFWLSVHMVDSSTDVK